MDALEQMNKAGLIVTGNGKKPGLFNLIVDNAYNSGFTNFSWIIFTLVVVLFIGSRLWYLTSYSLWTDEIFSLTVVRLSWNEMFVKLILDKVHPPLFYIILKIWVAIGGDSLLWLKLLPVLIASATILPFYYLCRELNLSARATNVTLLLMAVNGYLIYYSQEVRMYILLFFFTVGSFWLFARFVNDTTKKKRYLIYLFICNLFLIYSHYFGFIVVSTEGLFLLLADRRKFFLFLILVAALILFFTPWAYIVINALILKQGPVTGLDWIGRPNFNSIILYFNTLTGPLEFAGSSYLRLLLFGGPVLVWLIQTIIYSIKNKTGLRSNRELFWWLIISLFIPLTFIYEFSTYGPKSIWMERYLIILLLPFMLLIGTSLDRLRPAWLQAGMIMLVIGWSTLGGIKYVSEPNDLERVPWQSMVNKMIDSESPDASDIKIYVFESNVLRPLQFYLAERHETRFEPVMIKDVTKVEGNHFWIAFLERSEARRGISIEETLHNKGYQTGNGFSAGVSNRREFLLPVSR